MEFRQAGESHAIFLPPRSLLVMAGPARYCWQHYIPHRKADQVQGTMLPRAPRRMSFTFRQVQSPAVANGHTLRNTCAAQTCFVL